MTHPLATAKTRVSVHGPGWGLAAVAFAVAVAVLLACYWPTVQSLVWVWGHDGTYEYAFLIFPLSAWVAFTLRDSLRSHPPAPSVWGLVAVAVLAGIWYVGQSLDVNLARHFALVAMFPALILALWGWRAVWVLAFPLGYLVFAVPWGNGMVGTLQDTTAYFAVHALDWTGIPVLMNGREIITPSAVWMVEQACSGVRFFIACTALGCLFAYLMYRHWWKRVLFVVLAAIVPIIANGLRVYFTVLIGEAFGLKYATGTDHMIFGWQFFGTVLLLLLLAGWFLRDRLVVGTRPPASDERVPGVRPTIWPVAIALLVVAPAVAAVLVSPAPAEVIHLRAPTIAGWMGPRTAADGWIPSFQGAAGQVQAAYRSSRSGAVVELFHAVYTGKPRPGHDLITYGNDVYDSAKSRILSTAGQHVTFAHGRDAPAGELRLTGEADSRLVWYWYCVDGQCTRSPILTKLLQAWAVLRGRAPRSSVWALSSRLVNGDTNRARKTLHAFARSLSLAGTRAKDLPAAAVAGAGP